MSKLPRESKTCVVVQSQQNDVGGNSAYKHGLKVYTVLFAALIAWRIAWPLVAMVVGNQWLVCLALAVFVAAAYMPLYWFVCWLADVPLAGKEKEEREKNLSMYVVQYWVITERWVKRYYSNYFQCWPVNSVKSCEVKGQYLLVSYLDNHVEQLPLDGFSNATQLQVAQELLSVGFVSEADTFEPLENSIEVESSYLKEALKAFRAHCPVQRYTKKISYRRLIGMGVAYIVFVAFDTLANGGPTPLAGALLSIFGYAVPEALSFWMTGADLETLHCWRIHLEGFRFGVRTFGGYRETCRKWSDLQEVVETREGLLLKFEHPPHSTFLPKDTIPLTDWNECAEAIRMLSGKEFVVADQTPSLKPKMISC